jgi:hypothetical protein
MVLPDLDTQSSSPEALRIESYAPEAKAEWDQFVRRSKNGTFLFCRDYMDYHRDRFTDGSLLVKNDKGEIVALLPANVDGTTLVSHGGLTYGGFVTGSAMSAPLMLTVFQQVSAFLRLQGIRKVVYKTIPRIYHQMPADEDMYALFRADARLFRRDVTSAAIPGVVPFRERRKRAIKKASRAGITCAESECLSGFWRVLEWNLREVHGLRPVHSLEEIERLRASFPNEIKLFAAFDGNELVAGTVIYETAMVAHAQYTASSAAGRASGALDLLSAYLLEHVYRAKPYFDFGVSTESAGQHLNSGLVEFKEGFGGRTVVHDFYELDL